MKCVFAVLLTLCFMVPAHAQDELSFGYIGAPLSYTSLAVLKAAYGKLGIDAHGMKLPAARALAESAAGKTDGEVHRIKGINAAYPSLMLVNVPINSVEGLAITCDKMVDTSSLEAISGYRIGIKIGTRYAENLVEGLSFVVRKADEENLMGMLLAGRLDVVIGDRPWAEGQQRKPGRQCVRINEPPLVVIPLYHYLHERNRVLVPQIEAVLRNMRQSGELDQVLRVAHEELRNGVQP